jgi:hypothetical protein
MPLQFQGTEGPGTDKAKERRSTERIGLIDFSLIVLHHGGDPAGVLLLAC